MDFSEIKTWRIILANRIGAARKYDAFYAAIKFGKVVEGVDLTVDIELPDPARDELGKLRAEVKNEDFFLHGQR